MATSKLVSAAAAEVFVSYASADEPAVREIVAALEAAGVSIWRDGDRVLGGQYYGERISHAIAHSRAVLLMCSPRAFESDNVHREVLLTWDYYHRTFVPVWLTPREEIPHRFRYCLVGCQQVLAQDQRAANIAAILTALESIGVSTSRCPETVLGRSPSTESGQPRGPRFKPGDRPLPGVDWQLVELLGKGGFGEVWKAVHADLPSQPPVALKFALNLDSTAKELLRHEAEMVLRAQQAVKNAGVVPLLHAYLSSDPPCLEYAYYDGSTLVRLIEQRRHSPATFPLGQVQPIVQRMAQIVGQFHRAQPRVVHCDLKPSNILVKQQGEGKLSLRVTDFGIGRIASEASMERSRSGSSLEGSMSAVLTGAYTPLYASPQQVRGQRPEPQDDVYALGVIWYQLLAADVTAPAPTGRKWMDSLRQQGMSAAGIDLLAACLEAVSGDRPADGQALAEELARLRSARKAEAAVVAETIPEPGSPPAIPPSDSLEAELVEVTLAGSDSKARWLEPADTVGAASAATHRPSSTPGESPFAPLKSAIVPKPPLAPARSLVWRPMLGNTQLDPHGPSWPLVLLGSYWAVLLLGLCAFAGVTLMTVVVEAIVFGLLATFLACGTIAALHWTVGLIAHGAPVSKLAVLAAVLASSVVQACAAALATLAVVDVISAFVDPSYTMLFVALFMLGFCAAFLMWLAWLGVFGARVMQSHSPMLVYLELSRLLFKISTVGALIVTISRVIERGVATGAFSQAVMIAGTIGALLAGGPALACLAIDRCLLAHSPSQREFRDSRSHHMHPAWLIAWGGALGLCLLVVIAGWMFQPAAK